MSRDRALNWSAFSLALLLSTLASGPAVWGDVVINELVEDEQDFETTDIPDTREFVELYNSGASAVDIGGWTLNTFDLEANAPLTSDAIPLGTMLAPGGYYVIGGASVPFVNLTPFNGELWTNLKTSFELKDGGGVLKDAVAVDTFRGNELANASQILLDQIAAGEVVGPNAKGGWWGQLESNNNGPDASFPNLPMSLGRYLDGRDTNVNGRDFGLIPATPGAANNLAQVAAHVVPDGQPVGTVLHSAYYGSFKLPRVIAPGTASLYNPTAISQSPQGGNALIAWDETGGGNAVFSDQYVNKFELWAYVDPTPFNVTAADTTQSEASIYGIGTTDPLFGTPNSADLLTGQPGTGGNITSSANGSTGLGWVIQRRTSNAAGVQSSAAVLQLVDFNDGGDGVLADNDWQVITTIDLTGMSAAWHSLSIDYNPATGDVTAKHNDQTIDFDTATGLVGNFYVGYREQLPGTGGTIARPPTYDLFVSAPAEDADFDNDSDVDGNDFLIWQRGLGVGTTNLTGDANGSGTVNAADLAIWKTKFGIPATAAVGAVPEPGALGLALFAVGAALAGGMPRRFRSIT